MKRTERRHLKQNELQRFALQAHRVVEDRQREVSVAIIAVLVIAAIGGGYAIWRGRVQSRAHALLAEALAVQEAKINVLGSPSAAGGYPNERARLQAAVAKFKAAADAYPSTDTGIFARYREAATQAELGNSAAAVPGYEEVIRRSGDDIYGQMARLGLAEVHARSGQFDQAINIFKELAQRKDGPLPVDGILMQLGRTYREAGKRADAQQTFNRLVQEYPESPFMSDAKRELDSLNKT
jgi:tetratricopeptide (TPR) repeat protein